MLRTRFLFTNQEKVDNFILTHKHNPFPAPPASSDFLENPAKFIIGRDKELQKILDTLQKSLKEPESKLMFITGKQGIGKSTIISSIPRYLEEHQLQNKVMTVHFNISNDPKDYHFLNFYQQMIQFLEKTDFLERLVYASLSKVLSFAKTEGGRLAEELMNISLSQEYVEASIRDPGFLKNLIIGSKIPILPADFKKYLQKNYLLLRKYLEFDLNFLLTLIEAFTGPEAYQATQALEGKGNYNGFNITTDNLALNTFNDIKKLNRWVFGEATFLLLFDHLERALTSPQEVFQAIFTLLHSIRQQTYTSILISGTLDAFKSLYQVLEEDMKLQLDNWLSFYESLKSLSTQSVVNIVKRHLADYYAHSNFQPPFDYALYPFGSESLTYLYDNTNEDIRKTLIELYQIMEDYKKNEKIIPVVTFFEAISHFRQDKSLELKSREVTYLANKLLDPNMQDKQRSTNVENVIIDLIQKCRKNFPAITDIKHEPPIGKNKLKPDVYIELFGALSLRGVKKVGIEVKIYRVALEVPKNEVEKTHSLLQTKDLDYVLWVTTVPLSSVKHAIEDELKAKIGRITQLTKEEQSYLALAIYFEEIFGRGYDSEEALFLLEKTGIPLEYVIKQMETENAVQAATPATAKVVEEGARSNKLASWLEEASQVGRNQGVVEEEPNTPTGSPSDKPEPQSAYSKAKEINTTISSLITKASEAGRTWSNKDTIIREAKKKLKITNDLTQDDEEQFDAIIDEIASKKGLKITPTRIYFKV